MNRNLPPSFAGIAFLLSLAALPLSATTIFQTGTFGSDDKIQFFNLNVPIAGLLKVQTFGYAGGTSALGSPVGGGGFDPVITVFDSNGDYLTANNDGPCGTVGTDAVTGNCFDSFVSFFVSAGSYTVALTENDNLANGPTLADSFTRAGTGDFSCLEFLNTSGAFCDASPSHRTGGYALDITYPTGGTPVPEPSAAILVVAALALFGRKR